MNKTFDSIIIGGGVSGLTAAIYLLRNKKSVLIIEKETIGGQISNSPRVENFPTINAISGPELSDRMFEQVSSLGAEFDMDEVINVKKENDLFYVKTKYSEYVGKTLLIANGVTHRLLKLENEEKFIGKGISFCALCDGPLIAGKEGHIIGDANTAMQYALLLTDYCSKVHIYTLFGKFFGEKDLIEKVNSNDKIIIHHKYELKAYLGEDKLNGLLFTNLNTDKEEKVDTENVFLCVGKVPTNEIFAEFVDLEKGYILTDDNMATKTSGVYASGDTRKKDVRQLITACSDGAIAALSIIKYLS